MEMDNGSDSEYTETYQMPGEGARISSTPSAEEVQAMGNEAAPEFMMNQGIYYPATSFYGYYCTGFEAPGEWDDHSRFLGVDGQDHHYPDFQTEGSYVYYAPTYGYAQSAYNPYNPYIPGAAVVGVDNLLIGSQPYYPGLVYPPASGYFPSILLPAQDALPATPPEVMPLVVDSVDVSRMTDEANRPRPTPASSMTKHSSETTGNGDSHTGSSHVSKISSQKRSEVLQMNVASAGQPSPQKVTSSTSSPAPAPGSQGMHSPVLVQAKDEYLHGKILPFSEPGNVTSSFKDEMVGLKSHGHGWVNVDKLKPRMHFIGNRGNGNGTSDALIEQNRGPRINRVGNQVTLVRSPANLAGTSHGQDSIVHNTDQYNRANFPVKYSDAKFFVIKSYSEDDVHKSIKYHVWSSTPSGNNRLNTAFEDAQRRSGGKPGSCPVFLFFSVNASGQFCGVAEMVGRVDFQKDMDFWQQDKWSGCFPVKWHFVKDVPNSYFRHIILENNENKPVTNSRDTQEIRFPQGIEMLAIFKNYASKTSILDDFKYYEDRQRVLQEKKSRLLAKHYQQDGCLMPQLLEPSDLKKTPKPEEHSLKAHTTDDITSILKVGSISIGPDLRKRNDESEKERVLKLNNATAKDNLEASLDGPSVFTVGSIPVNVNGFDHSSGVLTVGSIPIDPKTQVISKIGSKSAKGSK
ncbi:hypothetical protein AMTRI_Chr03g47680 [Amborella trichopoda]